MTAILSYATIIEEVLEQLERGAENVSEAFEQIQYYELNGSQAVNAIQQYVEQFPGREALTTMEVLEEVEYMVGRFGNDGFDITNIELVATVIREKMVTELRNHVFEYGEDVTNEEAIETLEELLQIPYNHEVEDLKRIDSTEVHS